MYLRQKEAELEAARREIEDRKRESEEEDIRILRKEAIHKAQPVPHYNPFAVLPSDKPVTAPMSPHFQCPERMRKRSEKQITEGQNLSETFDV